MMPVGYVYILSNRTLPGLLKIGYTTHVVEDRAAELSASTGVVDAFQVEYWQLTAAADEVERRVHERFNGSRVNKKREFFDVDIDEAIEEIERHVKPPPDNFRRTPPKAAANGMHECRRCGHRYKKEPGKLFLCPACGF